MSYRCFVCSKGPVTGKTISHSHRKTNRRFSPNLQRVRITVGSQPRRVYVCTTCLHSNRVRKAP
ncbi:MAG TPA: 50S ribosomal protein L28 [Elusimicrobiota bacterium]|nr:50S ribosomal protein L28 [Elusimicrobiota bacterium]